MCLVRGSAALVFVFGVLIAPIAAQRGNGPDEPAVHGWMFDLYGTFLAEAWDYNLSKENLAGGSIAIRQQRTPRWSFGGEACLFAAKQRGHNRDAVLIGGGPLIHGQFPVSGRAAFVADLALGVSRADRRVPPRGTRVNYLVRTSGGVSYATRRSVTALLLVTYLHLSNASLEGRDRNPDIQSLGAMLGISVPIAVP